MTVIVYDSEDTWRRVVEEYPAIGGVKLRGDMVRSDTDGALQPTVTPAVASDGRRMQCHDFNTNDFDSFKEYWADLIAEGKIQILSSPPADWRPEGWTEPTAESTAEGWTETKPEEMT